MAYKAALANALEAGHDVLKLGGEAMTRLLHTGSSKKESVPLVCFPPKQSRESSVRRFQSCACFFQRLGGSIDSGMADIL